MLNPLLPLFFVLLTRFLYPTLANYQDLSLEESSSSMGNMLNDGAFLDLFSEGGADLSSSSSSDNLPPWGDGGFDTTIQSFNPDGAPPSINLDLFVADEEVGISPTTLNDFSPFDASGNLASFSSASAGCSYSQQQPQVLRKKERKKRGATDVCNADDANENHNDGSPVLPNLDKVTHDAMWMLSKKRNDNPCDEEDDVVCCPQSEEFMSGALLGVRQCGFFLGILQCLTVQEGNVYCCWQVTEESNGRLAGLGCQRVQ